MSTDVNELCAEGDLSIGVGGIKSKNRLEYGRYASQYDRMCDLLPVYQDNIDYLLEKLPSLNLPAKPAICDLGAGTGNFICALADLLPEAFYTHVDVDPTMNGYARSKYVDRQLRNVTIVEDYIQLANFEPATFDLVLCVNALNTAPPQLPVLRRIKSWIKPTGFLFIIDFGRKQNVLDWGWYILSNTVRRYGIRRYVKALVENREAVRQNRRAVEDQTKGLMWVHSAEQFREVVEKAGFEVVESQTCYRGYCDLIIGRPKDS